VEDLVDPVGIEPDDLFHAMEWRKSQLADGKGFDSRTNRQEPLKSAYFATKMLLKTRVTNLLPNLIWAEG
jgi:hypothetical protein